MVVILQPQSGIIVTVKREITTHTLDNGLSLVHLPSDRPVAWLGLAIDAGSRDEDDNELGLAHFVEHTLFKGTRRRRAWHINSRMERVGGELNAYTTKETTMLYSVFPARHLDRAFDLIADLVTDSQFPAAELEREREVVLEEAASYLDSPADAVFDDFEDILFAGSRLGHNILGSEPCLRRLGTDDCRRFLARFYTPRRMTLYCLGDYKPERVIRLAKRYFGAMTDRNDVRTMQRVLPPLTRPDRVERVLGLHQAHTIVGTRVGGMHSDDRFAMALLNNILGGPGMNSLLNVELRERRGLVYSVESSVTAYTDCGAWMAYLGCERDKLDKALAIIGRVVAELAGTTLPARRLDAYKKQYCGQLLVASDNTEAVVLGAGRALLYDGCISTLAQSIEAINAVTAEQLRQAAQQLVMPNCTTLTMR